MNYYEEIIIKITNHINDEEYDIAKSLIEEELRMPYIPNDIDVKLRELLLQIKGNKEIVNKRLDDIKIIDYLYGDDLKQLMAVNQLVESNLRDYINVINDYFNSNCNKQALALLIDGLIRQEINYEFKLNKDGLEIVFNPRYIETIEDSDGYQVALEIINNKYGCSNPSLLNIAKDLLIRECYYSLPINYSEDEGDLLADYIIKELETSFDIR